MIIFSSIALFCPFSLLKDLLSILISHVQQRPCQAAAKHLVKCDDKIHGKGCAEAGTRHQLKHVATDRLQCTSATTSPCTTALVFPANASSHECKHQRALHGLRCHRLLRDPIAHRARQNKGNGTQTLHRPA